MGNDMKRRNRRDRLMTSFRLKAMIIFILSSLYFGTKIFKIGQNLMGLFPELKIINWKNNMDFNLGPECQRTWDVIQARSLAINGFLRNTSADRLLTGGYSKQRGTGNTVLQLKQQNPNAPHKNNCSAIIMINWGKFSYLIQGDLEAAASDPTKKEVA